MRYLPESQTQAFNVEYIAKDRWLWFKELMREEFCDRPIRVLDIGGGNGVFADKILQAFPNVEVVVLDCSKNLLEKNIDHPRKLLVLNSVENLAEIFSDEPFDLITINLVLHHLVGSSYHESKSNVLNSLEAVQKILSENGRIFICEHIYNGLIIDSLASRLIYGLTSIRNSFITKLFCKWGANTAGTGVCFQSRKMWHKVMEHAGLSVSRYEEDASRRVRKSHFFALHIRSHCLGYFWLEKRENRVPEEGVERLRKTA